MSRFVAEAQPNIALIKYWGKRNVDLNLPAADSLSLTLASLRTRMAVEFSPGLQSDELEVNGAPAPDMLDRVSRCLDSVCGSDRDPARVRSESNFPIAAGLASSASAFAALVVAADAAMAAGNDRQALARLAGEASGSAARSLFGGIVELHAGENEIELEQLATPADWPLELVVAVTEEGRKAVSSGEAMQRCATTSPFYSTWISRQEEDMRLARDAVGKRDFAALAAVAEHNCLKMHSLTWTSRPPIVYWNQATLDCMETIRELQSQSVPVFFTMDAGPQVKAICEPAASDVVRDALAHTAGVIRTMHSSLGDGARIVDET